MAWKWISKQSQNGNLQPGKTTTSEMWGYLLSRRLGQNNMGSEHANVRIEPLDLQIGTPHPKDPKSPPPWPDSWPLNWYLFQSHPPTIPTSTPYDWPPANWIDPVLNQGFWGSPPEMDILAVGDPLIAMVFGFLNEPWLVRWLKSRKKVAYVHTKVRWPPMKWW